MSIQSILVGQFHHPSGLLGRLAGWIMATRESNLSRNRWTVDLLDIEESDDVLELGPGPGVTLQLLLSRVPQGRVEIEKRRLETEVERSARVCG